MIQNEGSIVNNNTELLILVKEVLEFAQSYKSLVGERKKQLVIMLIKNIIDIELSKNNVEDILSELIKNSVDNIIDPAIELAIYVAKGNIKINKKVLKKSFRKFFPCLSTQ